MKTVLKKCTACYEEFFILKQLISETLKINIISLKMDNKTLHFKFPCNFWCILLYCNVNALQHQKLFGRQLICEGWHFTHMWKAALAWPHLFTKRKGGRGACNYFNSVTFFIAVPVKWAVMYLCVRGIDFGTGMVY
jgi:hypothetical protein